MGRGEGAPVAQRAKKAAKDNRDNSAAKGAATTALKLLAQAAALFDPSSSQGTNSGEESDEQFAGKDASPTQQVEGEAGKVTAKKWPETKVPLETSNEEREERQLRESVTPNDDEDFVNTLLGVGPGEGGEKDHAHVADLEARARSRKRTMLAPRFLMDPMSVHDENTAGIGIVSAQVVKDIRGRVADTAGRLNRSVLPATAAASKNRSRTGGTTTHALGRQQKSVDADDDRGDFGGGDSFPKNVGSLRWNDVLSPLLVPVTAGASVQLGSREGQHADMKKLGLHAARKAKQVLRRHWIESEGVSTAGYGSHQREHRRTTTNIDKEYLGHRDRGSGESQCDQEHHATIHQLSPLEGDNSDFEEGVDVYLDGTGDGGGGGGNGNYDLMFQLDMEYSTSPPRNRPKFGERTSFTVRKEGLPIHLRETPRLKTFRRPFAAHFDFS